MHPTNIWGSLYSLRFFWQDCASIQHAIRSDLRTSSNPLHQRKVLRKECSRIFYHHWTEEKFSRGTGSETLQAFCISLYISPSACQTGLPGMMATLGLPGPCWGIHTFSSNKLPILTTTKMSLYGLLENIPRYSLLGIVSSQRFVHCTTSLQLRILPFPTLSPKTHQWTVAPVTKAFAFPT